MKILWKIVFYVREYFFPSGCALCGEGLFSLDECWYGLCDSCRAAVVVHEENQCRLCGRPLISEEGECLPCRNGGDRDCGQIIALFPYAGKYRLLLGAYKFGKSRSLGHFFAEQIQGYLAALSPEEAEQWAAAVWAPVPPRPGKIRASGWDQVEYLASLLERGWRQSKGQPGSSGGLRLPVSRCLKRLPSQSQKKLGRVDRKINLRGRIRCRKKPPKDVIILDDVITTGSTLEACAGVLREGGADRVKGFCLFYSG